MPSPDLAVAKASFTATLIRHDPSPSAREEADKFQQLINKTVAQCSPANVQKCKQWILGNIVASDFCLASFAKYLVALSASFKDAPITESTGTGTNSRKGPDALPTREPSARRRRLHILYLLNDVLHHTKMRDELDSFAVALQGSLPQLVKNAAAFVNCPKQAEKIEILISLWQDKGYYSDHVLDSLRAVAKDAPTLSHADLKDEKTTAQSEKGSDNVPWALPSTHGDPSTPWYDLPAGNWLPLLEPNSTRPINPNLVRPLQMNSGPADQALIDAVKQVLNISDRIYSSDGSRANDTSVINEMGERVEVDEITGDIISGETYYGLSRDFCQRMKDRHRRTKDGGDPRGRSRSSQFDSMSLSRSPSPPAFKKRRLSESSRGRPKSRSQGRDGSRDRGQSHGSADGQPRSKSRSSSRGRGYKRRRDPSSSPGRSTSQSREYHRQRQDSYPRSRSISPHRQRVDHHDHDQDGRQRSPNEVSYQNRGPPPLPSYNQPFPLPGLPPPPPMASGFSHPPPLPNTSFQPPMPGIPFMPSQQGSYPNFAVPPPPPPPPPLQYQNQPWPPPPLHLLMNQQQQQAGAGRGWFGPGGAPPPPLPPSTGTDPAGHSWGIPTHQTGSQRVPSHGRGGSHRGRGAYRGGRGGWQ